jgi:hypothetical protein
MIGTKFEAPGRRKIPQRLHLPKPVRNTLISVVILLVLVMAAGAVYTWYIDGQPVKKPKVVTSAYQLTSPLPRAIKPAANARVGASVETLTSPVAPGDNAAITVRTLATATCKISVVYKSIASTDSGLVQKTADEYGTVSWTWTVGKTVPTGTWPVNVTCAYNGRTGYVRGDLIVQTNATSEN